MLYLEKQKSEQQIQLNEERMLFYTNITHELRTPLSLIIGPLEDISNESELLPKNKQKNPIDLSELSTPNESRR